MEDFKAEELRAVEALTLEELTHRRDRAKATEEDARHERQLCEYELGQRAWKAYQESKAR